MCLVCFSKQVLPTSLRDEEEYEEVVVEEEEGGDKSDSEMSDWCYKPLRPGGKAYQLRMQYEAHRAARSRSAKRFGRLFSQKKSPAVATPRVIPPRLLALKPAPSCAPGLPRVIPPRAIASSALKKNEADGQNMKDTVAEDDKKMKDTPEMDQNMSPRNENTADEFDDGVTEYVPTSEVPTSEMMASSDEEVGPEEVDVLPTRGWYVPL